MTTYTLNGHRHSTMQLQPEILKGIVANQVAQCTRARWRLRALPEQFSCLESTEPRVQLQGALKQIEALLQRNSQLLETVCLLGRALGDAHSLIYKDASIRQSDRNKLRLSHDFHEYTQQLCSEIRTHAPT